MNTKKDFLFLIFMLVACAWIGFLAGQDYEMEKFTETKGYLFEVIEIQDRQFYDVAKLCKEATVDLYCKRLTVDIKNRQIKNLEAQVDGLKIIINKDVKLKRLINR